MSDETITLDAVARRLALTPDQTAQARVVLGADRGPVRAVLAACRQAQRGERRRAHALNAALIDAIVETEEDACRRAA